ncbi:MFS transporter [Aliidongia dinghuensis]|nr:MFS transporter [Aliidongia dinghuensis]
MRRAAIRDRTILVPAAGAQLIATTGMYIVPVLLDALHGAAGLADSAASLLVTIELAASALTTLTVSAWAPSHSLRRGALLGGLTAIAGAALTLVAPALPLLAAARLLTGIGGGIVIAESAAVLARGLDKERLIAALTIISILNAALWLAVLPYAIDLFGYRGPYGALLLLGLVGTALLRRLPAPPVRHKAVRRQTRDADVVARHWRWPLVLVAAAIFVTQLGQGAFWSFEETFGARAGLEDHAIGLLLSLVTLFLLVGALGAAWAGARFGRLLPILALTGVNAAAILVVATATAPALFIAANLVQSVTNLSSVIYQLGLAATLDRSGRLVAASTGLVTLGNGIGPSLAAALAGTFGPASIGLSVLILTGLAWAGFSLAGAGRPATPTPAAAGPA